MAECHRATGPTPRCALPTSAWGTSAQTDLACADVVRLVPSHVLRTRVRTADRRTRAAPGGPGVTLYGVTLDARGVTLYGVTLDARGVTLYARG